MSIPQEHIQVWWYNVPFTRPNSTWPPAFSIRSVSFGLPGLWSWERAIAFPSTLKTARESPALLYTLPVIDCSLLQDCWIKSSEHTTYSTLSLVNKAATAVQPDVSFVNSGSKMQQHQIKLASDIWWQTTNQHVRLHLCQDNFFVTLRGSLPI